jgi:metallo-beta-lactamase family protein
MQLTFYGAIRTVTGSMHLVEANGQRILLDCGLFQGRRQEAYERNSHFPFSPRSIDAVILSHAHIDHCGNLPSLVKNGFSGHIICTSATRDLAAVMLRDSANIQVSDADFVNKIRRRNNDEPVEPLYTPQDAEQAIRQFVGINYDRPLDVAPGVEVNLRDAGHILGSAIVVLKLTEVNRTVKLAFSGDLGRRKTPILKDPTVITDADYLITESTYGDEEHEPIAAAEDHLVRTINAATSHSGHAIIPAFAVERTQEIVYALHRQHLSGGFGDVPVYVDSPLALDATDVFRLHPECFDTETAAFLQKTQDPFGFHTLHYIRSVEESKALNELRKPFVVIAASGMCESGRVLHHLKNGIEDPANTVILVSFQAQNTLGRRLQEHTRTVRIFGEEYNVRANVENISGLSAHADHNDLLWWIGQADGLGDVQDNMQAARRANGRLKQVFVVHGETQTAESLAAALRDAGISQVAVPNSGDCVQL